MATTRKQKEDLIGKYSELIRKSQGLILAEYSGLDTAGMSRLRNQLREAQAEFHVTKNTLAELALRQAGLAVPGDGLSQSTAVGFAFEDVPAAAKIMVNFAKDSELFKIKGGLLGKTVLSPEQVRGLAALPPLPVVRGQFLGVLRSPARGLASVIAGSVRQIVNVVKAYSDQGTEGGAAPA